MCCYVDKEKKNYKKYGKKIIKNNNISVELRFLTQNIQNCLLHSCSVLSLLLVLMKDKVTAKNTLKSDFT